MNRGLIWRWLPARRSGSEVPLVQVEPEKLFYRLLREARRLAALGRLLGGVVHLGEPPLTAPSTAATTARYRGLADSLELPDRAMPLNKFERAIPGEPTLIGQMARLAANAVVENYCLLKVKDSSTLAMRDQHAKTHGSVRAEFIVRDDLPAEFTTPLFRPGAHYPAIVRFSNGFGRPQSDSKLDGRGLSIKLRLGVDAETMLPRLAPDIARGGEQDFLFSSFPVFFCKDVVDYSEFMEGVMAPRDTWREKLGLARRWIWFFVRYPRQIILFFRVGLVRITNPLTATYHSMSPYLFGDDKVVRYIVSPMRSGDDDPPWWVYFWWPGSENFLRNALVRDLAPSGNDVALDFSIRLRHSARPEDVEDASLWWTRPLDRVVRLATIRIPRQDFQRPDWMLDCEQMMFSPWNCLQQHRPLGSINRMRLAVYLASLQVRRKLNMVRS
jgi:hypothetical protein